MCKEEAVQLENVEELTSPRAVDLSEKVSLFEGDITRLEIDAIVNAANKSLLGGGGGRQYNTNGRNLLERD